MYLLHGQILRSNHHLDSQSHLSPRKRDSNMLKQCIFLLPVGFLGLSLPRWIKICFLDQSIFTFGPYIKRPFISDLGVREIERQQPFSTLKRRESVHIFLYKKKKKISLSNQPKLRFSIYFLSDRAKICTESF